MSSFDRIRFEKTDSYDVTFYTYSGMPVPLGERVGKEEAVRLINRKLRSARLYGRPVSKIGPGQWEIQTPDDAFMVSDGEGILKVRRAYRRYRIILGRKVYLS